MMKPLSKSHCIIHWWRGTDALKLTTFPPGKRLWRVKIILERMLWRALEPATREHWINGAHLRKHLLEFGIEDKKISVKLSEINYSTNLGKKKHKGFNVLYFCPNLNVKDKKFKSWLYGWDVYQELVNHPELRGVTWIRVGEDRNRDLSPIFPTVDCYIRPTRHDGMPRLVRECRINEIPVYWKVDFKPSVREIVDFINDCRRKG